MPTKYPIDDLVDAYGALLQAIPPTAKHRHGADLEREVSLKDAMNERFPNVSDMQISDARWINIGLRYAQGYEQSTHDGRDASWPSSCFTVEGRRMTLIVKAAIHRHPRANVFLNAKKPNIARLVELFHRDYPDNVRWIEREVDEELKNPFVVAWLAEHAQ